jgi:cellulose synthase/poly-beta-1,6-N-acetylglucosamine synthase-like glycosyltransferase
VIVPDVCDFILAFRHRNLYAYFGYPLLLLAMSVVRRRVVSKKEITPSVSIVIAAHNEERIIKEKLENTLSLDYPKERLEVVVASDGSTDRTEEIARQYSERGVQLLPLTRCGKNERS